MLLRVSYVALETGLTRAVLQVFSELAKLGKSDRVKVDCLPCDICARRCAVMLSVQAC